MPVKYTIKNYTEDSHYHIFNSGLDDREIFLDEQDYSMFLSLLKRHLSREEHLSDRGALYESFAGRIELEAFCLMPSNYHLLIYLNNDKTAVSELMRRVIGTYTTYFNKKYDRAGPLFQGVFKATKIENGPTLLHATRYIHRNPVDYYNWQHSSLPHYIHGHHADWVVPDKVYKLYAWGTYETFLNDHLDYEASKVELIDILAHKRYMQAKRKKFE
jgi:putative transposase